MDTLLTKGSVENKLNTRILNTRKRTETICKPLKTEDYSVQPIVDVSPPKWHLGHTTWFFEQFVLVPFFPGYQIFSNDFAFLFNSYYNNAGERILRLNRGLMTRPTVQEVYDYRKYVTDHLENLTSDVLDQEVLDLIEVGIHHEQQHQELLTYDIKFILGMQPTYPIYNNDSFTIKPEDHHPSFISIEEGINIIGYQGKGYHFDNELGAHKVYIHPFRISNRLVTNREYLQFINDGGYQDFNLWHAEGWDWINSHGIISPMYWHKKDGEWFHYDYRGLVKLDPHRPVMHVSYFEAYAYAEWKNMRLPTEFEWEVASSKFEWGRLWEWTSSAYLPYPGFKKAPGALGEYNGKFMVNQHVLRGASVATPEGHARYTYRNFFSTSSRWLFSGIRLADHAK